MSDLRSVDCLPHRLRDRSPRHAAIAAGLLMAALMQSPLARAESPNSLAPDPMPPLATCPGSGQAVLLDGELPRLRARLDARQPVRIVTIGSSSTAGAGATTPDRSYPSQLEIDLLRRFPGVPVDVVNVGVNGQEIADMLARLDQDVLPLRPDLVVLQFGSNGLMRGVPIDTMERAARTCVQRIRAAGADVVLMDLQHAPRIDGVNHRDDVLRMIQRVAATTDAALFHRYRLMKTWATRMGDGYADMVATDQLHMTDTSYRCMAGALARSMERVAANTNPGLDRRANVAAAPSLTSSRPAAAASAP